MSFSSLQEAVFAALPAGVVVLDDAGLVLDVNPAIRELLPVVQDPQGRSLETAIPCEPLHRVLRVALEEKRTVEFVASVGRFDLLLRGVSLGERQGALAVVFDVTELQGAERARSDFAASVSHELRTPVTAILGYADTLLAEPEEHSPETVSMLEAIQRNTHRLGRLFTDLLQLYRVESRQGDLPLQELALGELLEDVVAGHRELSKKRRVDLVLEVEEACVARVNPESFGHIVGNLVNNALKYTESGGWVQVRAWKEQEESFVEVEDNGPGIDPVHQERIFERFFRLDAGRSRASGGSGLGLAIVKHLCRATGASISLHSIPGHGSTFTLRFPR